MNVMIIYKTII